MKKFKKAMSVIPLIIALILLFGIMNGDMQNWVNIFKSKLVTDKKAEKALEKTYPVGIIENYREAFIWADGRIPKAEIYDPDNKTGKPYPYYGISVNEGEWYGKCYDEDMEYNKSHKLNEKYIGAEKYNPDKLVVVGEKFDRKYMCVKNTIDSIEFIESLKECEERYYMSDGRVIAPYLSDDYTLDDIVLKHSISGDRFENQKLLYIKVKITVESESEWVQEVCVVPRMRIMKQKDDILVRDDYSSGYDICSQKDGKSILGNTSFPVYSDLGYFDTTLPNWDKIDESHYPMRKGEKVTYNLVYVLPEEYADDAYLVYDDIGHQEEFTYNLTDISIIKIIQ